MGRKKKAGARGDRGANRMKMTPAGIVGICMGLVLVGAGLQSVLGAGEYGGVYAVVLGAVFLAAVGWGIVRKR